MHKGFLAVSAPRVAVLGEVMVAVPVQHRADSGHALHREVARARLPRRAARAAWRAGRGTGSFRAEPRTAAASAGAAAVRARRAPPSAAGRRGGRTAVGAPRARPAAGDGGTIRPGPPRPGEGLSDRRGRGRGGERAATRARAARQRGRTGCGRCVCPPPLGAGAPARAGAPRWLPGSRMVCFASTRVREPGAAGHARARVPRRLPGRPAGGSGGGGAAVGRMRLRLGARRPRGRAARRPRPRLGRQRRRRRRQVREAQELCARLSRQRVQPLQAPRGRAAVLAAGRGGASAGGAVSLYRPCSLPLAAARQQAAPRARDRATHPGCA